MQLKSGTAFPGPSQAHGCVPGLARLLDGDVRYYDTHTGQSPDPA
jgi:hypothetical protein